jgi:predicted 2-oxoglutarate/Fe(II)-dependent dioxygenase YbiX
VTGVGVTGAFLPPPICAAVVREVERDGYWRWGEINNGGASRVDLDFRRSQWCELPASCDRVIADRLLAIARSLRREFGPLTSLEGPNLLRYRPGDFIRPHPDENPRTLVRPRKVSIVAFLNGGEFAGGALRLHDRGRVVSVEPRAGRFVAFPARTVHEVTPVAGGNRYALVAWLH